MPNVALTNDQFWQQLATWTVSAFRFEQQPAYAVDYERDLYDLFLAGTPEPPTKSEALRGWLIQVKQHTSKGKRIERVRIIDEPPTDYQRWTAWMDRWNREAGEIIHYLTRRKARVAQLLPAAGDTDWWLLDDERLMTMAYNDEGRRIGTHLTTEEAAVQQARLWRDLAVRTARGDDE